MARVKLSLSIACLFFSATVFAWDSQRASVPLIVDGRVVPYKVFALYLMPGQAFDVQFQAQAAQGRYAFAGQEAQLGASELVSPNFRIRQSGMYLTVATCLAGRQIFMSMISPKTGRWMI